MAWLPWALRDGLTGYLEALVTRFAFFKPIVPKLRDLLARAGQRRIVDLAAGAAASSATRLSLRAPCTGLLTAALAVRRCRLA